MVRAISAGGLSKLATRLGTEPLLILEIDWVDGANPISYADRDIGTAVLGRILEVSELDNVIDVTGSDNSQQLSVVLDDTDSSIKTIMDSQDIHQRNVRVYQWFDGLPLSDKFLLFAGKITSPVTWSEGERTVSFSVVSVLEDKEFGFSAEEGQFPFIPKDMIGAPWPSIFGKVLDCPALQINKAVTGTTLCGVGIISGADKHRNVPLGGNDGGFEASILLMSHQISHLDRCASAFDAPGFGQNPIRADEFREQANDIRRSLGESIDQRNQQLSCGQARRESKIEDAEDTGLGCNPLRILGGEDFPQNTGLTLNINGGLYTGHFVNDLFFISSRAHIDNEAEADEKFSQVEPDQCAQPATVQTFDFITAVPYPHGDVLDNSRIRTHGFIETAPNNSKPTLQQVAKHFWAEAGSRVVIQGDEPITYIVSITPGTVLQVKAFKQFTGERRLVNVPNNLYRVETKVYGSITAVQIVVNKSLSSIEGQGWSDDLYVTFESTIGPNPIDIMEYIIGLYTDLDIDTASFNAARTPVGVLPMNFPILDRRNTLEVLKEIAFQARCALWINNGRFHIKFLALEPTSDSTITLSDIDVRSIEVSLTPTEDLVTKMVISWRLSYADEEPNNIILRHNVQKYGTKEEEFDFYCYNQPDCIVKAATFWLIRKANTWKKIKFRSFLNKLNLETFDTATLNFDGRTYVASGNVKAVVDNASYDSEGNMVAFECSLPVKAGTLTPYIFYWPAGVDPNATFPTPPEILAGFAGGNGPGKDAVGDLPVGFTDTIGGGGVIFIGGPNIVFAGLSDRGDRRPSDVGFNAKEVIITPVFGELVVEQNPNPDLTLNYVDNLAAKPFNPFPDGELTIDIRKTNIIDSDDLNPSKVSRLSTIIREIDDEQKLVVRTDTQFGDGSDTDTFDFQFDDEGGKWGAGTAFLKDD